MAYNKHNLIKKAFYGGGYDAYNFPLELMESSDDLFQFAFIAKKTREEINSGATLLITERQYILTYNRGMGQGSHNNSIGRAWADINGKGVLNYRELVDSCHDAENKLLLARIYSERLADNMPIENMIVFSFARGAKISPAEFRNFMEFYDEYSWVLRRENFKACIKGKDMSIDEVKNYLESIIDPELDLSGVFPENEIIIGESTKEENNIKR